jgi:hypothetical protein
MGTHEDAVQRIARMNQEVSALQRAGRIEEGTSLADEAFFAALHELPEGHSLRAQSARNRGIMQWMSGNMEEAFKTLVVAIDFYGKAVETCRRRRQEREEAGDLEGAARIAEEQTSLAEALEQLRSNVFGGAEEKHAPANGGARSRTS